MMYTVVWRREALGELELGRPPGPGAVGEVPGQVLLVGAQDRDSELRARGQPTVHDRLVPDAEQDERRLERDGREGVDRHADKRAGPTVMSRDDCDAGRERAERAPQLRGIARVCRHNQPSACTAIVRAPFAGRGSLV